MEVIFLWGKKKEDNGIRGKEGTKKKGGWCSWGKSGIRGRCLILKKLKRKNSTKERGTGRGGKSEA